MDGHRVRTAGEESIAFAKLAARWPNHPRHFPRPELVVLRVQQQLGEERVQQPEKQEVAAAPDGLPLVLERVLRVQQQLEEERASQPEKQEVVAEEGLQLVLERVLPGVVASIDRDSIAIVPVQLIGRVARGYLQHEALAVLVAKTG